jgi:hypothetical protein
MVSHQMPMSGPSKSSIQSPSGAHLSDNKLGHERQRVFAPGTPFARCTHHLIRQLSVAAIATLVACAGMFARGSAAFAASPFPLQGEKKEEDKDKDKESKKSPFSKDVHNIKEFDIPESQLKEYYRGTRPHRKQDPGLLVEKVLRVDQPTAEEMHRFEELRRKEVTKEEDIALVEKVVRRQVASLTQPQKDWYSANSEGRKARDAIETALDASGGVNEKYFSVYKQSLLKFLPELLSNHIWVRVNAMKLLAKLKDERAIKVFCDQIDDPDQHESVKFMAMEGLETLGNGKLITQVNLETQAVNTLLQVLAKADQVHPFTRQQAVRALGAIGRPNRIVGGDDVDVAVALLKIVRDPNIRRADRAEAALLLANLHIAPQADYNFQYVAFEIAALAADVGAAAVNDPTTDDLHSSVYLVQSSYALVADKRPEKSPLAERAKKNVPANSKGDPAYIRQLGDQVTRLTVEGIKVYKPDVGVNKPAAGKGGAKPAAEDLGKKARDIKDGLKGKFTDQLNALTDMLKSRPPRSMKLTPSIDELGPPPALAGPRSSDVGSTEEGNGSKEHAESESSGSNSRSGP